MAFTDLPIFQALKSKMQWHQTRQGVLAENVAHADTPGYQARELKQYSFEEHLGRQNFGVAAARTSKAHFNGKMSGGDPAKVEKGETFEVTPSGNNVNLEEQMMKITENQMDYQAATSLYTKGLGIIRTALSKSV